MTDGLHADITTALSLPNNPQSKQLREQIIQAVYAFYFSNLYYLNSSLFESSGSLRSGGAKVQVQKAGVQGGSAKGRGLVIAAAVTWDDVANALNWLAGKCKIDDPPPPLETWTLQAQLYNMTNDDHYLQGFAIGTTSCYSFGVNEDTSHKLYQHQLGTNSYGALTAGDTNGSNSFITPDLGHANGMTLARYNDGSKDHLYMYVAAYNIDNIVTPQAIVKLEYNGTYYEQVAKYTYPYDWWRIGSVARMSGTGTDSQHKLLLKRGQDFFIVNVNSSFEGNAALPGLASNTQANFTISYGDVVYNSYTPQSFHYEPDHGGTIYVPMWGGISKANENVIFIYEGIDTASGVITPDHVTPLKKGTDPTAVFEIEDCGYPRGRDPASLNNVFWFNANGGTIKPDGLSIELANGAIYTDSSVTK